MLERVSKFLFVVELVLLVNPPTFGALFLTVVSVRAILAPDGGDSAEIRSFLPWVLIALLALVALWRLGIAFVASGRAGLRKVAMLWWWLALLGAMLPIGVLVAMAYLHSQGEDTAVPRLLELARWPTFVGLFGILVLVPYAHLLIERRIHVRQD